MTKFKQHVLKYRDENFNPELIIKNAKKSQNDVYLLEIKNKNLIEKTNLIYLGISPKLKITYKDGFITINNHNQKNITVKGDLQNYLEKTLNSYDFEKYPHPLPFSGGLVGYFSYDYVKYQIPEYNHIKNPFNLDDAGFMLFTEVIAFNPANSEVTLIQNLPQTEDSTILKLKSKLQRLQQQNYKLSPLQITEPLIPKYNQTEYQKLIKKVIKNIYKGNIFQMILSNPLQGQAKGDLFSLYNHVSGNYHSYFSLDDFQFVTASPETLLKKINNHLATFPLAGTRRRGKDKHEDQKFANELLNNQKEIAEHNMLVDLGRNDLGAVSKFNTVQVTEHMKLKKYQQVMHLASTVESTITDNKTTIDAIKAVFPAGTLSGAPKNSAINIINKLEQQHRGIYGGTFGYLDFNGDCDFAIGIRLAHKKADHLTVHSGAGIVADSISKNEYQECFNKSRVIIKALNETTKMEVLNNDSFN
ncbi:anthranilate synthase component I family protein [Fructilactobacillus vespulae]|uniref:anthranilate synthase component I family protein n=1 Tax=Fructilactobacillus vespulae TaxID=1249630 RepID=UPI0039B3DA45